MRVLFVCSGNICRSPMAAEYFRHRAAHGGLSHVVVDSAGTLGIEGAPAAPEALRALQEIGLDLTSHRSAGVDAPRVRAADAIVAMAHGHLVELARRFPAAGGARWLLRAFEQGPAPAPDAPDLPDPIGSTIEVYREQLLIMRRCLDHLALHLKHGGGIERG